MTPETTPTTNDPSVGRASYERIGAQYGAIVDNKPYNAFYERPATLALLPPLAGARVLEIGCGNGWYTELFLAQGATVTAFDVSPTMVEQTRARVGDRARLLLADLAQPFTFAAEGEFDLVVASLVLHYVADWEPVLAEVHRVLRPDGVLVFSTHHPTSDLNRHPESHYFAIEMVTEEWRGLGTVQFYRRPLVAITRAGQHGLCHRADGGAAAHRRVLRRASRRLCATAAVPRLLAGAGAQDFTPCPPGNLNRRDICWRSRSSRLGWAGWTINTPRPCKKRTPGQCPGAT